jgi:hypothetical protein
LASRAKRAGAVNATWPLWVNAVIALGIWLVALRSLYFG